MSHQPLASLTALAAPRRAAAHALPLFALLTIVTLCSALQNVQAQAVYRIVGPDGKVTFSDKPPATGLATPARTAGTPGTDAGGVLPFELRQVASRYPVTLYTAAKCAPCASARAFLIGRGVPFTEKTVASNEDIAALQRLLGDGTLPAASIGSQQLKGYSDAEWAQYLDAAGYPKTSVLPASYRNVPAAPLVAVQRPLEAGSAGTAAAAADGQSGNADRRLGGPAPAAPAPNENPAGIRF
ncbi:MAG: glutaredoxin family protein [Burkholderiales bacterium]